VKRAFVTGGSGYLGRNLIAALRERGLEVRALARSDAAAAAVEKAGAVAARGDLDDAGALAAGMEGCDVAFHSAAKADDWGPPEEFHRLNVDGTRRVCEAARKAAVPRLVHVSTEAVLVGGGPLVRVDETFPYPERAIGLYSVTKRLAERVALEANAPPGLSVVVVRPRFIWGRDDTTLLPRLVEAVRAGRFRWIAGGRYLTSTTHVANACEGLILAAERGRPGEVYFVTDGEPVEFRRFVGDLIRTQGVDPGEKAIPRPLARLFAAGAELVWRAFGRAGAPPVTRMAVAIAGEEVTLVDEKARRELGYRGGMTRERGLEELRAGGDMAPAKGGG